MDTIQNAVNNFALSLTTEVFTRRHEFLKPHKAQVSIEDTKRVLEEARERGMKASILYIIGLDPLRATLDGLRELAPHLTEFPTINLMQNYVSANEVLRDPSARSIGYFLKARKGIEEIFLPTHLRPRLWENYRPLWYTTFGEEMLDGQ